jgi:hypothetical protein
LEKISREELMKKVWFVLVALVILCGLFITTGEAAQLCWQVDSTNDALDGYVSIMASGGKWTRAIHGVYYVQSSIYLPIAGNMIKSPDGSNWYLQANTLFIDGYLAVAATLIPAHFLELDALFLSLT